MTMTERIPGLRFHKHSGLWRATFGTETVYYSPAESDSRARYEQDLARYLMRQRQAPAYVTVAELVSEIVAWAKARYSIGPQGNSEANTIRHALAFLDSTVQIKLPHMPRQSVYIPSVAADEFSAIHLAAVQEQMIELRKSRSYINGQIRRIKLAFARARVMGLVDAQTVADLDCVKGLRAGQAGVEERPTVTDVPDEHIDAVMQQLPPMPRAIVGVLRNSVLRPGEVLKMTVLNIDTSGDLWLFDLGIDHKTGRSTGKVKRKFLGAACQEHLRPFLDAAMATREIDATLWPSFGETGVYLRSSLCDAVARGCQSASVAHFHPHQIRHRGVTDEYERALREAIDRAKAVAGHDSDSASARYTHSELIDQERARAYG